MPSPDEHKLTFYRIPSLDGLRAVSIIFVLLDHLSRTTDYPFQPSSSWSLDLGYLGVRVFFVISGFLITHLLLEEHAATGHIQLRRFYLRRTLRIFPPYYALLLVLATLGWENLIRIAPSDLLHALTYTSNYQGSLRSWYTNHTWSLSVEEQFYILWPTLFAWLGRKKGISICLLLLAISPLIRFGYFLGDHESFIGDHFETVGDALATGCLLALTRDWLWSLGFYRKLLSSRLFFFIPLSILLAACLYQHPKLYYLCLVTSINVGIALGIDWCLRFPEGWLGRFLNMRFISTIGVMSYSLYLWQQLFLQPQSTAWMQMFPVNIIFTVIVGILSYYVIERPALRIRRSLERREWLK